jgi:hypoxanthine phosphoribosyltransferase
MNEPEKKIVLSNDQIMSRIGELARDISKDYADKDLVLLGVLNGVFMFFAELAQNLTVPAGVDFIRLASYGADSSSSGRVVMTKDVETDLTNRDVLIVEDIADSGLTLNWLREHLGKLGAASIATCVLIDKMERRSVTVPIEYTGFNIQEGFLVGFGLDFDGRYRCLPDIYHLTMP